jgi:uncharacterized protein YjiS (DUF1127 family)
MIDVVHLSGAALRRAEFAAPLERSLYRASIANGTRRALDDLPDNLLKDIGLARDDIPFVAGELAFARGDLARDASGATPAESGPARPLQRVAFSLAACVVMAILTLVVLEL